MINIDLSGIFDGSGGPLVSLEAPANYNVSKFPDDIADTPYFIVFRSVSKFKMSNFFGDIFSKKGIGTGLGFNLSAKLPTRGYALPVPSNLATTYNARYANESIGVSGALGRRVGAGIEMPDSFTAESIENSIKSAIEASNITSGDIKGAAASSAIAAVDSGGLVGAIAAKALGGGNLSALGAAGASGFLRGALVGAGIARNPHLATVFTGVDFRTHTFQYKLIAKNKDESDTIREMIRSFKYNMAPNYTLNDHVFQYPNEFDITLAAGQYLFKFGRSVLTQFDVNYSGEGTPAFFEESGAPYSVTINMSFQETEIVTKKEISQGR